MKKIAFIIALAGFTTAFAQENTNKAEKSTITKTTVKSSKGEEVSAKRVITEAKSNLELQNTEVNKTNYSVSMSPVKVDTEITYINDDLMYSFTDDGSNLKMMVVKDNKPAVYAEMKPLSQKGYYMVVREGNNNSIGYFNNEGNFVIESYNPNTDTLDVKIYESNK